MPCGVTLDKENLTMRIKTYSELIEIPTFIGRYEYLKLYGTVGESTFGSKRYINQLLYRTSEWLSFRSDIIVRDNGCDLGIRGREIGYRITVHHINQITVDDILDRHPKVFDPENVITTAHMTHEAIHYGNEDLLIKDIIRRSEHDTCPWKH